MWAYSVSRSRIYRKSRHGGGTFQDLPRICMSSPGDEVIKRKVGGGSAVKWFGNASDPDDSKAGLCFSPLWDSSEESARGSVFQSPMMAGR